MSFLKSSALLLLILPVLAFASTPLDTISQHDIDVIKSTSVNDILHYYTGRRLNKIKKKLAQGEDAASGTLVSIKGGARDRQKSAITNNEKKSENTAVIVYTMDDGSTYTVDFQYLEEQWKISNISLKIKF